MLFSAASRRPVTVKNSILASSRQFSSNNVENLPLLYAKRCENGQGSSFKFEIPEANRVPDHLINVSYSTFWNDFTHYSFYG